MSFISRPPLKLARDLLRVRRVPCSNLRKKDKEERDEDRYGKDSRTLTEVCR
jgi:hypothetical protein